jgi:arylformamidase
VKKYYNLSHPMHEGMITPPAPWHPIVEITQMGRHCLEGRESYRLSFGSHTGTHIDTPPHMVPDSGPRVDQIPLTTLIGPAKMLRIPKGSYEKITVKDLEDCGVKIEKGDRIVVNTGWYKTWLTQEFFREYPCFTPEAAQWLVDKGVIYIMMDMPSPDDPTEKLVAGQPNPIHYIFLSNGVFISEYVTNLDNIPCNEFDIIALPLLVKDLDGAPTRIVAAVEE